MGVDLGGALEPPDGLAGLSDDAVGFVFDQYAATMAAAHAHLLAVIAEVGSREQMVCDDGARTVGAWVAARAGVRRATGEAWAGAAGRLASLPVMFASMAEGELSFDRVAPASQLATADTDGSVTELAKIEAAATLARAAADARRVERGRKRSGVDNLRVAENAEGTGGSIRGELYGDRFERVRNALEAEAARVPRRPDGSYEEGGLRMAIALDELASAAIADEADPDRATVVIHADADRFRSSGDDELVGTALFGSGLPTDTDTLRRLTCDCRAQLALHDASGLAVAVGSPQRTAPHWLRRLVVRRDRWCTFPGCETKRHLHAHHIVHWADGGPTIIENLIMVCAHHHRLLHDDGWGVALRRDGTTAWTRPGGVPFVPGPHTRLRELKRHLARRNDPTNRDPKRSRPSSPQAAGASPDSPPATGDPPGDPPRTADTA